MKVLIFGAGSVGTHYARAWSKVTSDITVVDTNPVALDRFRNLLWPSRYAEGPPNELRLVDADKFTWQQKYDLTVIGTPPSSHGNLLERILASQSSSNICVQKPISPPSVNEIELHLRSETVAKQLGVSLFSGFNHRHSPAFLLLLKRLRELDYRDQKVEITVHWRESWTGILQAHPWLAGPEDSYLGFTQQGGGASFEHSHGLDLGVFLWDYLGTGPMSGISANFEELPGESYDRKFSFNGWTENKKSSLSVVQDVLSEESNKSVHVKYPGTQVGVSFSKDKDVFSFRSGSEEQLIEFSKNRESDFDEEVKAVRTHLKSNRVEFEQRLSPLSYAAALNTAILGTICFLERSGGPKSDLRRVLDQRLGS